MGEPVRRGAVWTQERRGSNTGRRRAQAPRGDAGARCGAPAPRAARPTSLRLVADGGRLVPQASARQADARQVPVRTTAGRRAVSDQDRARRRAPVRLTRRGRIVITAAVALAIGALSMGLAGAAQATGHSGAPERHGGAAEVVIRAGQSLWSVAEASDPDADTRLVIQQILQINSLKSDELQPGQVLWVPRG